MKHAVPIFHFPIDSSSDLKPSKLCISPHNCDQPIFVDETGVHYYNPHRTWPLDIHKSKVDWSDAHATTHLNAVFINLAKSRKAFRLIIKDVEIEGTRPFEYIEVTIPRNSRLYLGTMNNIDFFLTHDSKNIFAKHQLHYLGENNPVFDHFLVSDTHIVLWKMDKQLFHYLTFDYRRNQVEATGSFAQTREGDSTIIPLLYKDTILIHNLIITIHNITSSQTKRYLGPRYPTWDCFLIGFKEAPGGLAIYIAERFDKCFIVQEIFLSKHAIAGQLLLSVSEYPEITSCFTTFIREFNIDRNLAVHGLITLSDNIYEIFSDSATNAVRVRRLTDLSTEQWTDELVVQFTIDEFSEIFFTLNSATIITNGGTFLSLWYKDGQFQHELFILGNSDRRRIHYNCIYSDKQTTLFLCSLTTVEQRKLKFEDSDSEEKPSESYDAENEGYLEVYRNGVSWTIPLPRWTGVGKTYTSEEYVTLIYHDCIGYATTISCVSIAGQRVIGNVKIRGLYGDALLIHQWVIVKEYCLFTLANVVTKEIIHSFSGVVESCSHFLGCYDAGDGYFIIYWIGEKQDVYKTKLFIPSEQLALAESKVKKLEALMQDQQRENDRLRRELQEYRGWFAAPNNKQATELLQNHAAPTQLSRTSMTALYSASSAGNNANAVLDSTAVDKNSGNGRIKRAEKRVIAATVVPMNGSYASGSSNHRNMEKKKEPGYWKGLEERRTKVADWIKEKLMLRSAIPIHECVDYARTLADVRKQDAMRMVRNVATANGFSATKDDLIRKEQ